MVDPHTARQTLETICGTIDPDGPGCAVGVYQDGEAIALAGFGKAHLEHDVDITPDTVFHIASLSKHFTAAAILVLIAQDRLTLDSAIGTFLPELQCGQDITVEQILHHVSGLRDQWGLLDLGGWRHDDIKTTADIVHLAQSQTALNFEPGRRFQYINTGYTLLGVILERITGQSLRTFSHTHLFAPLGMNATHIHDDFNEIVAHRAEAYSIDDTTGLLQRNVPAYATAGPTGVFSTVADFAKWERNFVQAHVLTRTQIASMHRLGHLSDGAPTGYGLGLALGSYKGLSTAEHAGGDAGYRAHYLRFPDTRTAIAVFCNTPNYPAGALARSVADGILATAFDADTDHRPNALAAATSRAAGVRAPDADALALFCGRYQEPGGQDAADLTLEDGQFALTGLDGHRFALTVVDDVTFAFTGLDARCTLEPRPNAPTRMRTYFGGTETSMLEFVANPDTPNRPLLATDYTGSFFSTELGLSYDVKADGPHAILLHRGKKGTHPLTEIAPDQFVCAGGLIVVFERSTKDQSVTGFKVSTERVWNVVFQRSDGSSGPA